ncbi:DUF559 domain-containing protein [bacterium]|nr:MAG: DUF559 domain-containing protein [bacterium]
MKISHHKNPTPQAQALINALESRGVTVFTEFYDGSKTIDLTIPKAKLNIEVDGLHHITQAKQIITDISRGYYSQKNGYHTIHIQNETIEKHVALIADALAEVETVLKNKIHIHIKK